MVADYADGQEPKRGRGRIYHVRYLGRDSDRVKPDKGLNAESYFERCEEQGELAYQFVRPQTNKCSLVRR